MKWRGRDGHAVVSTANADNESPEDLTPLPSMDMRIEPSPTTEGSALILSARFFYVTVAVVALSAVAWVAWAMI
ncbi:hypothetical protein O4220_13325 [Rhodococcus ruber]|uniref:Transmembrane protein n=1 Tax=Rhodococcus ruber TaxID=1830 RepID=A0ABT4MFL7_9NOCA|nr:hypothetical protein [Rhodococcus ruber]MCZ4519499.1 hypothetical protein [Rhodococcus ruber]